MQGLSRRIVAMSRMRHRTLMTCASTFQPRVSVARTLTIGLALGVSLSAQTATAQPSSSSAREVLDRYCVTCHSERLETAGLSLEQIQGSLPDRLRDARTDDAPADELINIFM